MRRRCWYGGGDGGTYGEKRSRALSDEKDEAEEKEGSLRRRYHERTRQTQTTTSRQWLDRDFGPRGELLVMAGQGGEKGGKRREQQMLSFFFFSRTIFPARRQPFTFNYLRI